ncbi:MAG: penicillin-binding protein 2 [Myxococcota bacterium]
MMLLSPRREIGEFRKRYKWMALFATAVFLLLGARIAQLQLLERDHWSAVAQENITKTITLPATRGVVRDANGRIVAANRPSYTVYVTPQLMLPGDAQRVAELMGLGPEELAALEERLERVPPHRRLHQIEMFSDISREQLAALETHSTELAGVDVVAVPVRQYPYRHLGAHAVGYLNEVSAEDLERLEGQGYRSGDFVGRTGIERAWEGYLRGRRGFERVLVDARGERVEGEVDAPRSGEMHRDPVPGRDLAVTLDMDLMRVVERAFRGHPSGGVVVVETDTGRVRALYSKPSYDLGEMSGHLTHTRFQEMVEDPFRPLIDKTLYESYFPGSIFKPVSALAALGDEVLDPSDRVDCPGYYELGNRKFRCTHAHGEVDLEAAIVGSCNVYFWKLAEQVGMDRLHKYAKMVGLGLPTGIGINTEASGFIPTREWYRKRNDNRFRIGFTLNTAIGQGNTRTTLIQMAMAYAAIANGGVLYVPQLVTEVTAPDGSLIERFGPRVRRNVDVDPAHLEYVRAGMQGVVNDPDGTAYDARVPGGVSVAGKTGTAEVARRPLREGEDPRRAWYYRRDHAWFAGFAPADDPRIAVVVLVEHGGAGGKTAAPIAMQIVQEYLGPEVAAASEADSEVLAARGRRGR